jgi:hypothetical protein
LRGGKGAGVWLYNGGEVFDVTDVAAVEGFRSLTDIAAKLSESGVGEVEEAAAELRPGIGRTVLWRDASAGKALIIVSYCSSVMKSRSESASSSCTSIS